MVKTLGQVLEYWLVRSAARASSCRRGSARPISSSGATAMKRLAGETCEPVVEAEPEDKRFADPEWSSNQFFDFLKQAYLLTHRLGRAAGRRTPKALDPHTRQKAEFYVKQIANAVVAVELRADQSRAAARDAVSRNAENLVRGMQMLAEDIEAGGGDLKIRQSDASKFEVGRNLALTPGKVIFQNELMQLIQYAPSTANVLKRAAADRAAVDQQVLRARSRRRRNPSSSGASIRGSPCS